MSIRQRFVSESGVALVSVVLLGSVLTILAITLMASAISEEKRSAHGVWRETAFQAAEAGVDDYVSKLVDDRQYYLHQVHLGESTRQDSGGGSAAAGVAWTYGPTWTYPSGKDAWRTLANGYQYNLQVTPPNASSPYVKIVATGRKSGSTEDVRVLETYIRPTSLADFYRVVNGDVSWGAGAITNGKIWAKGDIDHDGTATADMMAEGSISGSYTLQNGAKTYTPSTNPSIWTKIKNPLNFANFVTSFVDVQRAAQVGGIHLDAPSYAAWRLTFNPGGTVKVERCLKNSGRDVADGLAGASPSQLPICSIYTPPGCASGICAVPSNGAIYTSQTAIVLGQVNGRVTVASNDDIVIGGDIDYISDSDDVLGLAATNDVVIARYTPDVMTWQAGVLAQNGTWKTFTQDGSHTKMTFRGSSATNLGGGLTMFDVRDYGYQPELQYLSPPWFPVIGDAYTVLLFRELPAST